MKPSYHYLMLLNQSAFQKILYESIADLKLSMGEPKIFDFLFENDGCMQKEIAIGCQIEAASVTSILLKMEKEGYVERKGKDGNRRSLYVYLTKVGWDVAKKVRIAMDAVEEEALKRLSETEKVQLIETLKKINENLLGEFF